VKHSVGGIENFDPFAILNVPVDASDADIKKAYRKLSLQYHPDKNPDPKAHQYFATYIAKAYKALTDEVSKENYKKYGHPDGPQAMSVSVALPEWFFSKDKQTAPLILLVLLFGGIVTPLGIAAWYLMGTQKFVGPNQLMEETIQLFLDPRYGVKPSQVCSWPSQAAPAVPACDPSPAMHNGSAS
jgi:translocation protein SEC63